MIALLLRAIPEETYGPEHIGSAAFVLVPLWFAVTGIVLARRTGRSRESTIPAQPDAAIPLGQREI